MRICVDIDGVLFPWDRVAREYLEDHYGHELGASICWHALKDAVPTAHWQALWTRHGQDAVFGQVERHYKSDVAAVNDLLARGHEVHFVTHRDPRHTLHHTAAFLARHFHGHPWAGVHSIKSRTPKRTLGAWDVMIDDKPETVLDMAARETTMVFAPLRSWNRAELEGEASPYLHVYEDPTDILRWVREQR